MKVEYNPKMPIILQSIKTLYSLPNCSAGGCCHIVTDDDNIQDEDLQFVIDYCNEPENADRVDKELSELICKLLLQLSFEQRCVLFYMFLSDYFNNYCLLDESTWDAFIDYVSDKTIEEMVEQFTYERNKE